MKWVEKGPSYTLLQSLAMRAPTAIAVVDGPAQIFTIANPAYLDVAGRRDLIGRSIREIFPTLAAQGFFDQLDRALLEGKAFVGRDMPIQRHVHGTTVQEPRYFDFVCEPVRGQNDQFSSIVLYATEVTEWIHDRRRVEKLAAERELILAQEREARLEAERERARLRDLVHHSPAAVAVTFGPDHSIVTSNALCQLVAGGQALAGQKYHESVPPAQSESIRAILDSVYQSGETFVGKEVPVVFDRHDGVTNEAVFSYFYAPMRGPDERVEGVFIYGIEVTEQLRVRQEVTVERDRLQQVVALQVLPEAIAIVDLVSGQYVFTNSAAITLMGTDLVGATLPIGKTMAEDLRALDGAPICNDDLPLQRSLRTGDNVLGEPYWLRHATEERDIPVVIRSSPLRTAAGTIVGAIATFQDISDVLHDSQMKDDLLVGIAHDLRTPLTTIKGSAQFLTHRLEVDAIEPAQLRTDLERINASAESMTTMVDLLVTKDPLRTPAHADPVRPVTDLGLLVRRAVAQHVLMRDKIEISVDIQDADFADNWDAGDVDRVLSNLFVNATKYGYGADKIQVGLRLEEDGPQSYAVFTVTDHGRGILPGDLDHVFERRFRGHNVQGVSGSGIGLASVKEIAQRYGGDVTVESVPGEKTTFTVRLPFGDHDPAGKTRGQPISGPPIDDAPASALDA